MAHMMTIVGGKRVRGWNGLNGLAVDHPDYYRTWMMNAERRLPVGAYIGHERKPGQILCVVMSDGGDANGAAATVANVRDVLGMCADVFTTGVSVENVVRLDESAEIALGDVINAARKVEHGVRWLLPIRAGDTISKALPEMIASAEAISPEVEIVFWDVDVSRSGRREAPWLRGVWDPWLHLSRDTLGGASVIAMSGMQRLGESILHLPFGVRAIAAAQISLAHSGGCLPVHVPGVGSHWATSCGPVSKTNWRSIIDAHWPEPVVYSDGETGQFLHPLPRAPDIWPPVTIIIPTKDQPEHLAACIKGLDFLDYPRPVQRVIVDNGTTDSRALQILSDLRSRDDTIVLRAEGPFNFSALNNTAVRHSNGDYLCLLNNDVEALDGDWLKTLIRFAVLPEVGAVGPLLTYPDGRIQHAGVVIGIGDAAGHVCRFGKPSDLPHRAWHGAVRTVSAVTAACLVVSRSNFEAVGGLDEEAFAVAFNDIDFCLKLQAIGLVNIFTPGAWLVHHESVSRGDDMEPVNRSRFEGELRRFKDRWKTAGFMDPRYSPLFSRSSERCLLRF